jgi:prevent-host-death family protein
MFAMRSIGLFEAKNKLSELVEAAGAGEEIIITKRGKPVARLSSVQAPAYDKAAAEKAMMEIDARREEHARKFGVLERGEILALIREGRKY